MATLKITTEFPAFLKYSGDVNPLEHGGKWMDPRDWKGDNPDANVLELDPDDNVPYGLVVCRVVRGTVTANMERIEAALQCCGFKTQRAEFPETEIDAVCGYAGMGDDELYRIGWWDVEDLRPEDKAKCQKYAYKYLNPYLFNNRDEAEAHVADLLKEWK